jgi:hypothetical protein
LPKTAPAVEESQVQVVVEAPAGATENEGRSVVEFVKNNDAQSVTAPVEESPVQVVVEAPSAATEHEGRSVVEIIENSDAQSGRSAVKSVESVDTQKVATPVEENQVQVVVDAPPAAAENEGRSVVEINQNTDTQRVTTPVEQINVQSLVAPLVENNVESVAIDETKVQVTSVEESNDQRSLDNRYDESTSSLPAFTDSFTNVWDPIQASDQPIFWYIGLAGGQTFTSIAAKCLGLVQCSPKSPGNGTQIALAPVSLPKS